MQPEEFLDCSHSYSLGNKPWKLVGFLFDIYYQKSFINWYGIYACTCVHMFICTEDISHWYTGPDIIGMSHHRRRNRSVVENIGKNGLRSKTFSR